MHDATCRRSPENPTLFFKKKTMAAFPEIEKIHYEGPDSTNPLAFRHYNAEEMV